MYTDTVICERGCSEISGGSIAACEKLRIILLTVKNVKLKLFKAASAFSHLKKYHRPRP